MADLGSVSAQIKQAQDTLDQLLAKATKEKTKAEQATRDSRAQQARQASAAEALLAAVRDLTSRHKETQLTVAHLMLERDTRDADLKQLVLALFVEKEMKDCEMRTEVEGLLAESNQAHQRMEEAVLQFSAGMSPALKVTAEKPSVARPFESTSLAMPVVSLDSRFPVNQSDYLAPQTEQPADDSWVVCEGSPPVKAESSQTSSSNEPAEESSMPTEDASRLIEETGRPAEASGTFTDEPGGPPEEFSVDEAIPIEPLDLICGVKVPNKKNHSNKSGSLPSVILAHVRDETKFGISVKMAPNSDRDIRLRMLERDMAHSAHPVQGEDSVPEVGCFVSVHSGDSWQRAEISAVDDCGRHAKVHLIDYGLDWLVTFSQLRSLPTKFRTLQCQARSVNLSFVNFVSETDPCRRQAVSRLRGLCEGRYLRATVEYSEHSNLHVSLSDPKTTDFSAEINAQLIREGFVSLIPGKLKPAHSKTTRMNLRAAENAYQQSVKVQSTGKVI